MKKIETIGKLDIEIAVAIVLCLISTLFLPFLQSMTACISVLLCVQDTAKLSLKAGLIRLLITVIGGAVAVLVVWLDVQIGNRWIFILMAGAGILLTLWGCKMAKVPYINARIGGVTFILVILTKQGMDRIPYAVFRLVSTAYGVLMVLLVTWLFQLAWPAKEGN